jgi:RimJ/RimL family protein N-acetyltransferase
VKPGFLKQGNLRFVIEQHQLMLRSANKSDLEALTGFERFLTLSSDGNASTSIDQLLEDDESLVLIAEFIGSSEAGGVGAVLLRSMDISEIEFGLFISPNFRKRGFGAAITVRVLAELRDLNIERVEVMILKSNTFANAVAKKSGFVISEMSKSKHRVNFSSDKAKAVELLEIVLSSSCPTGR